ncbi:MAG: diguanylate cyclase [Alphaproteobacteria bacterium]|nr:diguanylate cyclase [Alphaproteobacteria bacterium]
MVVGAEKQEAGAWSRQALERLARDGLPPAPHNYALYYLYFSGENKELNAVWDKLAAQGKITQAQCDALYDKYLVTDNELAFLKDANSILDNELKKVLDLLNASTKETDQFGENLDAFSGKLNRAGSIDTLREAVGKIAEETHAIAQQNSKLQQELADTTVQLSEIRSDFDRVHREAQIDPLTEVGNRKFFDHEILRTMTEAQEQNTVMSLLMIDIDHFKKFNDTHGHLIGDQVLRLVARTLVENLKGRDVIARYGGEEFVIVLPQTRLQDAERVANQLRAGLASKHITKRGTNEVLGVVTISIGAAEYVVGEDSDTLISRADAAMYKAKQTGRNRVVCAEAETTKLI